MKKTLVYARMVRDKLIALGCSLISQNIFGKDLILKFNKGNVSDRTIEDFLSKINMNYRLEIGKDTFTVLLISPESHED